MPRLKYRDYRPGKLAKAMIQLANEILEEYTEQGFKLTLRQLYYQFVAREYLPNTDKQYARLGDIVSRAREAGMIDWDHLQDRGRNVQSFPHWDKPGDIIRDCVHSYHRDLWHDQEVRVEVWVEKDALSDVVGKAARRWDVPYFANKGYLSTSAAWDAGHNRFLQWKQTHDQDTIIIHLGDHDPSGIQMTEDIERRVKLFSSAYDDLDAPKSVYIGSRSIWTRSRGSISRPTRPSKATAATSNTSRNSDWRIPGSLMLWSPPTLWN